MVCKKSGLARLAEGVGAGAAAFSARACCHPEGVQRGSHLQAGTRARAGWESPVTNNLPIGQPKRPPANHWKEKRLSVWHLLT